MVENNNVHKYELDLVLDQYASNPLINSIPIDEKEVKVTILPNIPGQFNSDIVLQLENMNTANIPNPHLNPTQKIWFSYVYKSRVSNTEHFKWRTAAQDYPDYLNVTICLKNPPFSKLENTDSQTQNTQSTQGTQNTSMNTIGAVSTTASGYPTFQTVNPLGTGTYTGTYAGTYAGAYVVGPAGSTPHTQNEYKLVFRPNMGLAKKFFYETQTIPVKFLQIIYMFYRINSGEIELKDSESELMSPNPPKFKVNLYDYQAKTLTWMRRIESGDIKIKYYKDYYYGLIDPDTGSPFCYISSRDVEETAKTLANYHIYQDPPDFYKEFKINGGLLGDIMGNGKTVTGIAHIYSTQVRTSREQSYPTLTKGIEQDVYLPSRATLILCPNNIIDQWYNEFVKCLGPIVNSKDGYNGYRVIKIATMHHLNCLSHADIINADAIIVTYNMMTNTNHIGKGFTKENGFSEQYAEQMLAKSSIPEICCDAPHTWNVSHLKELERVLPKKLLYLYKWNRVIHDEFHEVINTKTRTNSLLFIIKSLLKARFYWGFSGSSILDNENILMNLPYLLHFEDDWSEVLPMTGINKTLFFDKCVIKNTKRILPPLRYEKISVKASEEEKMLYKAMAVYSCTEDQVRFACYHNLNPALNPLGANNYAANSYAVTNANANTNTIAKRLLSADEIMAQQQETRLARIKTCKYELQVLTNLCQDLVTSLSNIKSLNDYQFTKGWKPATLIADLGFLTDSSHKDHNAKVKAALEIDPGLKRAKDIVKDYKRGQIDIDKCKDTIRGLTDACDMYTDFLTNKKLGCGLCDFSSTDCSNFMALPCHDHFCRECTDLMIASCQKMCPKCRKIPFESSKLANLGTKDQLAKEVLSVSGLNKRLWGSKTCDIVDKVQQLVLEDPTNKIIIFAQWEDLLEQFEVSLSEVKIEAVTVKGATSVRTKAIRLFQEKPSCKVILLSSVYGASGINLTEANYVIIVHPFLGDMGEQYEYQAICRAYRTGQKRVVTVMHFIREDTMELPLYNKKDYKNEEGAAPELLRDVIPEASSDTTSMLSTSMSTSSAMSSAMSATGPKVTLKLPSALKSLYLKSDMTREPATISTSNVEPTKRLPLPSLRPRTKTVLVVDTNVSPPLVTETITSTVVLDGTVSTPSLSEVNTSMPMNKDIDLSVAPINADLPKILSKPAPTLTLPTAGIKVPIVSGLVRPRLLSIPKSTTTT